LCGELLRYLAQQKGGCGGVIGGQTLVTLDDERCYCDGEEASLWSWGERERDEVSNGRIPIGGRFGASDVQR
jgi:hypothetical protein